jgi:hypothetical protein
VCCSRERITPQCSPLTTASCSSPAGCTTRFVRLLEAYGTGLAAARSEGSDPDYLPAGDPSFVDIGDLAYEIAHDMQQLHESWSGQELVVTAAYGIRTYRRGQTLRRHCDRVETHVISSVVHIDHESDAPWPW